MYIGIDLGTSAVKLLLVDKYGNVIKNVSVEYHINNFNGNWNEQDPVDWWDSTVKGVKKLLSSTNRNEIKGISFGGQMHGLVLLDCNNDVIRPAILWNDGRTEEETSYLNNIIGKEKLLKYTGNIAFAGFTAPKILWVRNNEPNNFFRINKILLPKDYLAYCFSGVFSTDFSDASGTLLLDVKNKCWSKEMCEIVGISEEKLPKLYESYEVVGIIKKEVAELLGLPYDVKIITGAGDNAAAALGTGTILKNTCNISLGTSGTVFVSVDNYDPEGNIPIHYFNHVNGKYHLMGCILSAASCNKWWVENILKDNYDNAYKELYELIGNNHIYFLPYLMGERCPHNDTNARGAFIGLRSNTKKENLTLAVLEGVAFALKECLDLIEQKGTTTSRITLCGGGAKNMLWAEIISNIFNKPIDFVETEQGPGFGAAILAMVGCGEYKSLEEASGKLVHIAKSIYPDQKIVAKYRKKYSFYKKFFYNLKELFANWE